MLKKTGPRSFRVVALKSGSIVADGAPADAFRTDRLRDVFEVPAELLRAPDGRYWIRYAD